jgi:acetyl-CoA carboxylase biotin carboxyl carrier protein
MDLRKLKKLIDLVQESGIGELEITEGEEKVRISRNASGQPVVTTAGAPAAALSPGHLRPPPRRRATR